MNQYLTQFLSYHLETFRNRFPSLIYIQNGPYVFFSDPGDPLDSNLKKFNLDFEICIKLHTRMKYYDILTFESNMKQNMNNTYIFVPDAQNS